jgi:hypothetical protein
VCYSLLPSSLALILLKSEAHVVFQLGKQCNGWFNSDHLLEQVNHAINIFDHMSNGQAQGLFIFDNAPSHQKRAPDVLSACYMVKGVPLSSCLHLN